MGKSTGDQPTLPFGATFRAHQRVRYTDPRGKVRETTVWGIPAPDSCHGPGMVHINSGWLSINFLTVPERSLTAI